MSKPKRLKSKKFAFKKIKVTVRDKEHFKGINIAWSEPSVGFGNLYIGFGVSQKIKTQYPPFYGFHTDTEGMSEGFLKALLVAASPEIANIALKFDPFLKSGLKLTNRKTKRKAK